MDALLPSCANTFGQRGHKWQRLLGGRRCVVCGKQEPLPNFVPSRIRLAEFYWLRVVPPRILVTAVA